MDIASESLLVMRGVLLRLLSRFAVSSACSLSLSFLPSFSPSSSRSVVLKGLPDNNFSSFVVRIDGEVE